MTTKFYDKSKIGTIYKPDFRAIIQSGKDFAKKSGIPSSNKAMNSGSPNIIVCCIDFQCGFVNPPNSNYPGSLYVPGSEGDVGRTCDFIFNNVQHITHIIASLDTHYIYQPFHAFNWEAGSKPYPGYEEGQHPNPFTLISLNDMDNDRWRPVVRPIKMREMVTKLEQNSKKTLCIWPIHSCLGTGDHLLDQTLMSVIMWHAGVRGDQYDLTEKGLSQLSEHYGILKAEVHFDEDKKTDLNMDMVNKWTAADRVYFCGEAASHCCLETFNQIAEFLQKHGQTELMKKLYILEDCMSNVPDISLPDGTVVAPFAKLTADRFVELKSMGFKFVKSTDPINL